MFLLLRKKHENSLYIKQMVKKTLNPKSLLQSSFQPNLLDAPMRTRRKTIPGKVGIFFEKLPKPLEPAKFVPPKPVAPPRRKKTSSSSTKWRN